MILDAINVGLQCQGSCDVGFPLLNSVMWCC